MKQQPIKLWKEQEYSYPFAFGYCPDMVPYLHEDNSLRPCVIVVPGGGYAVVSPTEGEMVAERFYASGFQSFVFSYTTNLLMAVPLMDQPMKDLARAIRLIRSRSEELRVDPNRIAICGFSAGGHLCASICVHFNDIPDVDEELNAVSARPDAAILSYPVITTGDYAHRDSFRALLGQDIYEREDAEAKQLLHYYSAEKHVSAETPPCFVWQTMTDELVPVENGIAMVRALREQGIDCACHLFSQGKHGLSLANEDWAALRIGDAHCFDQALRILDAARAGILPLPEEIQTGLVNALSPDPEKREEPNEEVQSWPELAICWLKRQFRM